MNALKVLIADDHGVVRDGLRMLIEGQPDMSVVAEVRNAFDVVDRATESGCNVVLLDISMPGQSLDQIPLLKESCPAARILVLTMHDSAEYRRRATDAGAAGYVLKRSAGSTLLSAIRGEDMPPPTQDIVPAVPPAPSGPEHTLSPREAEVLRLVSAGFTNQETADQLGLSIKTVEGYRARVRRKLGARSRVDLVRHAIRLGLLDPASTPQA